MAAIRRIKSLSGRGLAWIGVAAALAAAFSTLQVAASSAATTHRGKQQSHRAHKHKTHGAHAHGSATGLGQLSGLLPTAI